MSLITLYHLPLDVSVGFSQDYIVVYEDENPPTVFVQVYEGALKREIRVNVIKLDLSEDTIIIISQCL